MSTQSDLYELAKKAVTVNPTVIRCIQNPSEELCNIAISRDPGCIKYISNPSTPILLKAIKTNPMLIQTMYNPSEELCIAAVSRNGYVIEHIAERLQTPLVIMTAIRRNPNSIRHVKKPTLEHVLLAASLEAQPEMWGNFKSDKIG